MATYIFFLFRDRYGFGDLGNLGVAALMGFVIAVAAWQGGKFSQRQGCFRAMFLGQGGMMAALSLGALFPQLPVQLPVLVLWTASQFVVWPALEYLVTEGEDRTGRARLVGIYSVVWETCSALSYFFGGGLFERLGSGSIFWLPPGLHLVQVLILWRFARRHEEPVSAPVSQTWAANPLPTQLRSGLDPRAFQRMAWLASCTRRRILGFVGSGDIHPPVWVDMSGNQLVADILSALELDQQDHPLAVVAQPLIEDKVSQPVEDRNAVDARPVGSATPYPCRYSIWSP